MQRLQDLSNGVPAGKSLLSLTLIRFVVAELVPAPFLMSDIPVRFLSLETSRFGYNGQYHVIFRSAGNGKQKECDRPE